MPGLGERLLASHPDTHPAGGPDAYTGCGSPFQARAVWRDVTAPGEIRFQTPFQS